MKQNIKYYVVIYNTYGQMAHGVKQHPSFTNYQAT